MDEKSLIAEAITKDSKGDRIFAYGLLIGGSIVSVVVGSVMWGLISTLAGNMETMAADMSSMKGSMTSMAANMSSMDNSMVDMKGNIATMSSDMSGMNESMKVMVGDVSENDNTGGMKKIMKDFNKINPANLF